MTNAELQELLKQYPDNTPILMSIDTPHDGLFVTSKIEFTSVSREFDNKIKYIELIGEIEE